MIREQHLPEISVVIPVYNQEKFVAQTIDSVLSQTFQDIEILLVDDGSTDRSPEIIKQYAAQYPEKIVYIEHDNHKNYGVSVSRNVGIKRAQGKYVAFLDADDLWSPEKLECQLYVLERYHEVAFVYCQLALIDHEGNPTTEMYEAYVIGEGIHDKAFQAFDLSFSRKIAFGFGSTPLIRKHILFEVGLFDTGLKYQYEDEVLAGKIAYRYPVYFLPQPLAKYRIHGKNACSDLMSNDQWRKVEYAIMIRLYRWLKTTSPDIHSHSFRARLATLSYEAYKRKSISRWSLWKLLVQMFPYTSPDLKMLKVFLALLLERS